MSRCAGRAGPSDEPVPAPSDVRERGATTRPFPSSRRLVTAAVRAGRRVVPMVGLLDVDVTEARRLLAASDPPLSFTAFVVASLARAAAAHPEVHAYRDWRGRLVQHRHVDVQTLVEVATRQGPFALVHVVRDADVRDVAAISAELRAVRTTSSTRGGRLLGTVAPALGRVPGLYRVMYAAMARSRRVHLATGTVQVTAVGMFAGGGGFAIAPPTLASLAVVVGGVSRRARVVDGDRIEAREVLDLTVSIDHDIVDGAPAARFSADLRRILHSAVVLPGATGSVGAQRGGPPR